MAMTANNPPVPVALTGTASQPAPAVPARSAIGTVAWWIGGGIEIALMGLAVPVGILVVGLPIALAVKAIIALLSR